MKTLASIAILLAAAPLARAQDHIHITVDTFMEEGVPTTLIDAGYNASESAFDIDTTGRLTENDEIAVFRLTDPVTGGVLDGFFAGLAITFTSDFYFSTGRLDGGDFHYEITAVEPISGPAADIVFGGFHGGLPEIEADSAATDRDGRSLPVGAGSHPHGQFQAVSQPGLYDVTIVAWDANALYADSDPVTFRINSCSPDFDNNGAVDVFDLLAYLDVWFTSSTEADLDQSGGIDVFDLLMFLDGWFIGC